MVITVNGNSYDAGTDTTNLVYNIPLEEGNNEIEVSAFDKANNRVSRTYSTSVDNTPPRIIEHNLADLSPTYSREVTVRGKVSENASIRIIVNGRENTPFQCLDGIDNDNDGLTDYPNDPGCDDAKDLIEQEAGSFSPQCFDGKDNDGDGKIDFGNDLGCDKPSSDSEVNYEGPPTQCNDGIDNDNDGRTDFNPKANGDFGCVGLADNDESNDNNIGNVFTTQTDEDGTFSKQIDFTSSISTKLQTPLSSSVNTVPN